MLGFKKGKMKREIIVNAEALETRVAIMENGRLEEFKIERPSDERIVGNIYKGKVQNLEDGLRAAFVDLGLKRNAFMHYWDMIPEDSARMAAEDGGGRPSGKRGRRSNSRSKSKGKTDIPRQFPVGSEVVVQVTKGPIGTKGPRVTASLSIPGRFLVLLPGSKLKGISRKIEDPKERQRLRKVLSRLPTPKDAGIIIRTVAEGASQKSIARDMRGLLGVWEEMQENIKTSPVPGCVYREADLVERVVRDWMTEDVDRIVVDSPEKFEAIKKVARVFGRRVRSRIQLYEGDAPIFTHFDVERQMAEALRRRVALKCGGHIIFEEMEALVAIDVNTGRHKGDTHEETIIEVNTEAVEEVARQLRLRNVGGLVMIDLIDMRLRKHQNSVFRTFKAALARDKARTNVLQISKLGILEMSRQRTEGSIQSAIYTDCPYCEGRGRIRSPLSMSVEIQRQIAAVMRKHRPKKVALRIQVLVHPSVLERLKKEDEQVLMDLESKFTGHMTFKADLSRHPEGFSIINTDSGEELFTTGK